MDVCQVGTAEKPGAALANCGVGGMGLDDTRNLVRSVAKGVASRQAPAIHALDLDGAATLKVYPGVVNVSH